MGRRSRVTHNSSKADAIRYAFIRVGPALVINTVILAVGFAVLVVSSFKLTADMGLLTMLGIIFALLFDFLLLPGLLLWFGGEDKADAPVSNKGETDELLQTA